MTDDTFQPDWGRMLDLPADDTYQRLAAAVLVAHQRRDIRSCLCGWSERSAGPTPSTSRRSWPLPAPCRPSLPTARESDL